MPYKEDMDKIYQDGILPALNDLGYDAVRADQFTMVGDITKMIAKAIESSAIVIADVSDANANVMYEIGIAEKNMRSLILISRYNSTPPFHLRAHLTLFYRSADELRERLTNYLVKIGKVKIKK
jgi:hypothetical protein